MLTIDSYAPDDRNEELAKSCAVLGFTLARANWPELDPVDVKVDVSLIGNRWYATVEVLGHAGPYARLEFVLPGRNESV